MKIALMAVCVNKTLLFLISGKGQAALSFRTRLESKHLLNIILRFGLCTPTITYLNALFLWEYLIHSVKTVVGLSG